MHALLLGGYVSFPDDEENTELPKDSKEFFHNQPIWKRAIVLSAGVAANMLCAIALVMVTAAVTHKLPTDRAIVYVKILIRHRARLSMLRDCKKAILSSKSTAQILSSRFRQISMQKPVKNSTAMCLQKLTTTTSKNCKTKTLT